MRKILAGYLIILLCMATLIKAETPDKSNIFQKPKFNIGLSLGTNGGFSGEINGMITNLTQEMPINIRFAVGYTSLEPGVPEEARQIFINDATNGVPVENGRIYSYKFDFMIPFNLFALEKSYLYIGPRYKRFTANFNFVGGNEDFDIRSNQWGLGTGLETYFSVSQKFKMVLTSGVNYMKENRLQGHDTAYDPNGTTGLERNDYTYEDADNAINQPKLELKLMIGFTYGL